VEFIKHPLTSLTPGLKRVDNALRNTFEHSLATSTQTPDHLIMGQYQRKLRNYLIEPEFQLRLISYFAGLFAFTTISLYSTVFIFFWRLRQKALNVGIPEGHIFFQFVGNEKRDLDLTFALLALVNLIVLVGVGVVVSHRIAGPLHKLKNYLTQVISSEGPDFKLRKNDFLRDLEPVVNKLKTRIKE
jgi:hypothetical protein